MALALDSRPAIVCTKSNHWEWNVVAVDITDNLCVTEIGFGMCLVADAFLESKVQTS